MRWAVCLTVALPAAIGGCSSSWHECSGGAWLCPNDLACAAAPTYCGTAQQVTACDGSADFTSCSFKPDGVGSAVAGACFGGACFECSTDREGCSYSGWDAMTTPTTVDLYGVWAAGVGSAYAVG